MDIGSVVTAGRAPKSTVFADPFEEGRNIIRKDAKSLSSGMVPFSVQGNDKTTVNLPKGEKLTVVDVLA